MNELFKTAEQTKKSRFKSPLFFLVLISAVMLTSLSYGYTYYQQSQVDKQPQINVQQLLNNLLTAPDVAKYYWMRTLNPKAKSVEGGIVWSQKEQTGVMRFENLPATRQTQHYHLWVYDSEEKQPISSVIFQQSSYTTKKLRLVSFKPSKPVKAPYKFILKLESTVGNEAEQILLRVQL